MKDFAVSRNIFRILLDRGDIGFIDSEEEHIVVRVIEEICLDESLRCFLPRRLFETLYHLEKCILSQRV